VARERRVRTVTSTSSWTSSSAEVCSTMRSSRSTWKRYLAERSTWSLHAGFGPTSVIASFKKQSRCEGQGAVATHQQGNATE
jgi:hypothetical protein